MLSRRVPHQPELNAWALRLAERRAAGARLIDLTEMNTTRVGLAGAGREELAALVSADALRYEPDPRGSVTAREAIAAYYAARGTAVSPDQVVLTASTSEAYAHAFRLLGNPGERFIAPAPSYPLFEPLAAAEGVVLARYPLAYDGAWHLDRDAFVDAARGARAVIVVQPNVPTGSCLDAEELALVETTCARGGAAVISDEVFADFMWPGPAGPPSSLADSARALTLVMSGLSKVCGMPQLKLGWIVVTGPEAERREALDALEWIADLFLSVATPVQAALPRLLAARFRFQTALHQRVARNLAALDTLVERRPELSRLAAQGGWAAVLRLPERRTDEAWALALLGRDVVVHPGHFYDFPDARHLVVSLVPEPVVFDEGMRALEALAAEG